jgi:hypothetical protein
MTYEDEVAQYRAGKLAGPPAYDQPLDFAMLERWRAHRTGLAPYYPLLYSLVIGMGAQRVFEFGTGESSEVLLSALKQTGGHLVSCSPGAGGDGVTISDNWTHWDGLSQDVVPGLLGPDDVFDLVLHDGSHSAAVVEADLLGIIPRMKEGGLILIHDVLHSYVGEQMRAAVSKVQATKNTERFNSLAAREHPRAEEIWSVTLPFAFGLQILQIRNTSHDPVSIGPDKPSSPHRTLRWGEAP